MKKRRIAVLFHAGQWKFAVKWYVITHLARFWREDGHEVRFLFGTGTFEPADVLIMHVDLSVTPDAYLDFARRYPVVLNGQVRDIRKSSVSKNLLREGDGYRGKVIVKTDQNCAGQPERQLEHSWLWRLVAPAWDRIAGQSLRVMTPKDYPLFDSAGEVPASIWRSPDVVVEKFLPEEEGGLFHVRCQEFLGDRVSAYRLGGRHPVVNSQTKVVSENIEPDPRVEALRRELHFDYGKFDFVLRDGQVVLLDANKTTACGSPSAISPDLEQRRRYRAEGLYDFFEAS